MDPTSALNASSAPSSALLGNYTASSALVPLLLAALVVFLARRQSSSAAKGPLPPGPKGLPLIGNMWQLPKSRPWVKMEEWTREYGVLPPAPSAVIAEG